MSAILQPFQRARTLIENYFLKQLIRLKDTSSCSTTATIDPYPGLSDSELIDWIIIILFLLAFAFLLLCVISLERYRNA